MPRRSARFVLFTAAAMLLPLGAAHPPGESDVTITFIANEGVMLSDGSRKVLIDGLFRDYGPEYADPADSTLASLEAARAPFDAVDLVLVTHRHGDHFHPRSVAPHLLANPRATLVTSTQVIDSLRGRLPRDPGLAARIRARTTPIGARRTEVVNGIQVELLGLPHGGARHRTVVEHLGFLVTIGGRRILHVGRYRRIGGGLCAVPAGHRPG